MTSTAPRAVYHYLDIAPLGRGEVVKLFLTDTGIEFKEVLYPYDHTWPQNSQVLQQQGLTRTGKLPALEYQGLILTQHIPILRYLARDLGQYDGETNAEKYAVDAVADIYIDWRSRWVANLGKKDDAYKDDFVPQYYNLLGQYYNDRGGPYLLGDKVTYADFAVYQSIDNDARTGTLPSTLPESLLKFKETFEQRPNIASYLKSRKPVS
jgi:glutathione S-transferase